MSAGERTGLLGVNRRSSGYQAINDSSNEPMDAALADLTPKELRHETGANRPIQTYFTIVTGFVGGGMLGLPYGFSQGGIISCSIMLLLIAFVSNYTLKLLARCKMDYEKKVLGSYQDIGRETFGITGKLLVDASLGYASAYVVYIAKNIMALSFLQAHIHKLLYVVAALVLPLTFLCWIRKIKFLTPTSLLANVAIAVAVIVIVVFGFTHEKIRPFKDYREDNLSGLTIFYGLTAFAYAQHGLILNVHKAMRKPRHFPRVLDGATLFTTLVYWVFGLLGYLFFFDHTNSVITINLGDNIESDIIKIALCFILISAYPLQMMPLYQIFENFLVLTESKLTEKFGVGGKMSWLLDTTQRNVFRLILVCLSAAAAVFVPYFGPFSALVGSFTNSFIAFIFPPIFFLKLFWHEIAIWEKMWCIFVLLFGLAGMGLGSYTAIGEIVYDSQHPSIS